MVILSRRPILLIAKLLFWSCGDWFSGWKHLLFQQHWETGEKQNLDWCISPLWTVSQYFINALAWYLLQCTALVFFCRFGSF